MVKCGLPGLGKVNALGIGKHIFRDFLIKQVLTEGYVLEASGFGEDGEVGKQIPQGETSPRRWWWL